MGALSPTHWAIIIILVLLLFGSRKLPDLARGVGQSLRIFKAETTELRDGDKNAAKESDEKPAVEKGGSTAQVSGSGGSETSAHPTSAGATPSAPGASAGSGAASDDRAGESR